MNKQIKAAEVEVTEPSNGGAQAIEFSLPYIATVKLEGTCDMIFHGWNPEAVEEKARASKNSKAKKTDNVESYVYRNEAKELCVPGEYLRQSVINVAKFRQDPRSPRKSAMDLYKAAIVSLTPLASLGITKWDYLDKRRVVVQRQGINRTRPAVRVGWQASFQLMVVLPEYVPQEILREVVEAAGRLIGLGDFRPSYGRYSIVNWEVGPAV